MNNGKSLGYSQILKEAIKYANNDILIYATSKLFEKMINWDYVPEKFNIVKIIPLLKDEKGDLNSMNNIIPYQTCMKNTCLNK